MTDTQLHNEVAEQASLDCAVPLEIAERVFSRREPNDAVERRGHGRWLGQVAVLLPCHNEEVTIAKVVRDFRLAIPEATIYVYDNASTDDTASAAAANGAIVRHSPVPGKGNVLRQMFAEVDAAVYVLADGDDTYDALAAPSLIDLLHRRHLDMVVGKRVDSDDTGRIYRRGHRVGNRFLCGVVRWLFGGECVDMLSGYRVLSRQYVKSFPAFSTGFAIETEMTVHAKDLCLSSEEVPVAYRERPDGSESKLHTIPDGLRILLFSLQLCKDYRPLRFFGLAAFTSAAGAIALRLLSRVNLHPWGPASTAALALGAAAVVFVQMGVFLDALRRGRREMKRMLYLAASRESHSEERRARSDPRSVLRPDGAT